MVGDKFRPVEACRSTAVGFWATDANGVAVNAGCWIMQLDAKQSVAAALAIGMLIMLLNLIGNVPFSPSSGILSTPEETGLIGSAGQEKYYYGIADVESHANAQVSGDETPAYLWGQPGPLLKPCWRERITERTGRTWGYVLVRLSNGPHFHRIQVADAVVIARQLGATLMLPILKDVAKEPNGDFDKIYDVGNFISSLNGVVRVMGRFPEDIRSVAPTVVRVPYRVSSEYIQETVVPIFKQKMIIQVTSFFPTAALKVQGPLDKDADVVRCLVMYSAMRFHAQVQKLGERVINRVREAAEISGGRFVAVDLRTDILKEKGCIQLDEGNSKKCFNAHDVGAFLKRLGFSSATAVYVTQSRWDTSLHSLTEFFPNIYTKEYSMPFNEEKQILYSGKTQFEMAIDFYICTHSDVFIPATSGGAYVSIAGERIAMGKTPILVPKGNNVSSQLQVADVISQVVTTKEHAVYSCFCEPLA